MAVHGLSVFMETPKLLRKCRTRYIGISFTLLELVALSTILNAFEIFEWTFEATSPIGYLRIVQTNMRSWQWYLSLVCINIQVTIGDLLLVGGRL
jgi:hypothetical protein